MNTKKLLRRVVGVAALVAAFVVGTDLASTLKAREMVPECDCTVHNYPKPGDSLPGVRVNGECFLDPCGTKMD